MGNKINRRDIYPSRPSVRDDFVLGVDVSDTAADANGKVATFTIGDMLDAEQINATITGGTITGITQLDMAPGAAAQARVNLNAVGVTDTQTLTSKTLSRADNDFLMTDGEPDHRVKTFAALANLTSAKVAVDDLIEVVETGQRYVRVDDAASAHLDYTGAGGVKLKVLPGPNGIDITAFSSVGDGDLEAGTGTDNHAAIQKAADAAAGAVLYVPDGVFRMSSYVRLSSNTKVTGTGTIWNDRATYEPTSINNERSPFMMGFIALAMFGSRAIGSSDPWNPKCNTYTATANASAKDSTVTLAAGEGANFTVGELIVLRSQEYRLQTSTGVELQIPNDSGVYKVVGISGDTLTFEHPVGFDTPTPPIVCQFNGSTDVDVDFHAVERIEIKGIHLVGRTAFAHNNSGAYHCKMRDFTFDCYHFVQANGFAHSVIEAAKGTVEGRVVETKFCSHDSRISGIEVSDKGSGYTYSTISFGEGSRNIVVENFDIQQPGKTGGQIAQLQPGTNCVIRNGSIFAPNSVNNPVYFYADTGKSLKRCGLRNVTIVHASTAHVVFDSGTFEATECFIEGGEFVSSAAVTNGIEFQGGTKNVVSNLRYSGALNFTGVAANNVVSNCVTDTTTINGAEQTNNIHGPNYATGAGGLLTFGVRSLSDALQVSGTGKIPASGKGVEMDAPTGKGRVRGVDRDATTLQPLQVAGQEIEFMTGTGAPGNEAQRAIFNSSGDLVMGGVSLLSPGGTIATKGKTAAQIADASDTINTVGKRLGAMVVDTTNNRMLFAIGSAATADWYVVDGSASVTPA